MKVCFSNPLLESYTKEFFFLIAFAQYAPSTKSPNSITTLPLHKIVYILCNLLTLGVGLWKCRSMGLLPIGTGDWLAFESRRPVRSSVLEDPFQLLNACYSLPKYQYFEPTTSDWRSRHCRSKGRRIDRINKDGCIILYFPVAILVSRNFGILAYHQVLVPSTEVQFSLNQSRTSEGESSTQSKKHRVKVVHIAKKKHHSARHRRA